MDNKIQFDNMSQKLNIASAILRLILALVIFPHGAQKMLGWFGGYGFEASMTYFTEKAGLPSLIGFLVILIEFIGPFLLFLGCFTKTTSTFIFVLFCGILFTHRENGFFMNWFGNQAGEGIEYHLLVLAICLSIMILGPGRFTLGKLYKRQTINLMQY